MIDSFDATLRQTEALAEDLVERLRLRGLTVATAESLTAGLCAASIASVPGASAVLRGGLIVYATELKNRLAGVPQQLLEDRGAVDPDVAQELAKGAAQRCGANIGLGLTGVAGPDPQDGHDVGEVFVGVSVNGEAHVKKLQVSELLGEPDPVVVRQHIRQKAVNLALSSACEVLSR